MWWRGHAWLPLMVGVTIPIGKLARRRTNLALRTLKHCRAWG
ncbi:hypothetical protein BH18VER1_BH18VER1_21530 [soil metagenome]